jgi:hypothetical protein
MQKHYVVSMVRHSPMSTAVNVPKWTVSGDWFDVLMFVSVIYPVLVSMLKLQPMVTVKVSCISYPGNPIEVEVFHF